jgi:N-acetylmuramic acid 6-phosphate (MurNAc-6-P) etherase
MEILGVHRERARALLQDSHGQIKVAIVMGKSGVSREEAIALLEKEAGWVARVVGDLP